MRTTLTALLAVLALLLAIPAGADDDTAPTTEADDVVVIAVVDSGFAPYHQDFDADLMPQHLDADDTNDLPLDTPPDQWLPGFPSPDTFGSYDEISLTLDPDLSTAQAFDADRAEWDAFSRTETDGDDVNYRWLSGSKVIGAVDFSGNWQGSNTSHGAKVASVSTGNRFGTCPECLVVLVTYDSSSGARERASDWAMRQPWIDVVTNSYGYSTVLLEKYYTGASVEVSRAAVERGQQVFYSAGNGQANAFTAPQLTYYSSQKATDWVTTVGAVHPNGQAFTGAGKGVDIAGVGISYPSMGGTTYTGQATFSGTSNATPMSAGIYARSLWAARKALEGPSRVQDGGVVAVGEPVECGAAEPDCELGDGQLTRAELQNRFYSASTRTNAGLTLSQFANPVSGATTDEVEMFSTGHGVFFGRLNNPVDGASFGAEHARIVEPMLGLAEAPVVDADTAAFQTVDSYCKQLAWGTWNDGYYTDAASLPGPDPLWPLRTSLELVGCPALGITMEPDTAAVAPGSPLPDSEPNPGEPLTGH